MVSVWGWGGMRERERESNKTDPHTHTHRAERKCGDGDCGGEKTFSLLLPPLVSRPGPAQSLPRSLTIGLTQTINISLMTLSNNFQKPHFRSTTTCAETKELEKNGKSLSNNQITLLESVGLKGFCITDKHTNQQLLFFSFFPK